MFESPNRVSVEVERFPYVLASCEINAYLELPGPCVEAQPAHPIAIALTT